MSSGVALFEKERVWIDKEAVWAIVESEDSREFIEWLRENRGMTLDKSFSMEKFEFRVSGSAYPDQLGALLNLEIVDEILKLLRKFQREKGEKPKITVKRVFLDAIPTILQVNCNGKHYYFIIAPVISDGTFSIDDRVYSWDELSNKVFKAALEKESKDL